MLSLASVLTNWRLFYNTLFAEITPRDKPEGFVSAFANSLLKCRSVDAGIF